MTAVSITLGACEYSCDYRLFLQSAPVSGLRPNSPLPRHPSFSTSVRALFPNIHTKGAAEQAPIQYEVTAMPTTPEHLPEIAIQAEVFQRLETLVDTAVGSHSRSVMEYLERELERATIIEADDPSCGQTVTMYSVVTFLDEDTQEKREATLVYPHEADISQNKISVLSPIGAALIGMYAGKRITWHTPNNQRRVLQVLRVENP